MADWPGFWHEARSMCEASPDGSVELTIDEIRRMADSRDRSLNQCWPWNAAMNPDNTSHTGVLENGLECEPRPETGLIETLFIRIRR